MTSSSNNPRRLARSEDIPRAVEKLIQWVIRLAFYGIAFVVAVVATVGIANHWRWPVNAALLAIAAGAIGAGRLCGGPCPLVFVPPDAENDATAGKQEAEN